MKQAIELIGLAKSHPSISAFGQIYWQPALDEVRGDLPEEQVEAALERGAKLDLEETVAELLAESEASSS